MLRAVMPQDQAADRGGRHLFPTRASLIRLVGMVLAEQDDEWQDKRRYFRPETLAAIDTVVGHEEVGQAPPRRGT
jgi:hypothetical protein